MFKFVITFILFSLSFQSYACSIYSSLEGDKVLGGDCKLQNYSAKKALNGSNILYFVQFKIADEGYFQRNKSKYNDLPQATQEYRLKYRMLIGPIALEEIDAVKKRLASDGLVDLYVKYVIDRQAGSTVNKTFVAIPEITDTTSNTTTFIPKAARTANTTSVVPKVTKPVPKVVATPPKVTKPATKVVTTPPKVTKPATKVVMTTPPKVTKPATKVVTTTPPKVTKPATKVVTTPPKVTKPATKVVTTPPKVTKPVTKVVTTPPKVTKPAPKVIKITKVIPKEIKPAPKPTVVTPTVSKPAPKTVASIPAVTKPAPKTVVTVPTVTKPAPKTVATVPSVAKPAPKTVATVPAVTKPAPKTVATVPSVAKPAPKTVATVPAVTKPAPKTVATVPAVTKPAPKTVATVPAVTKPAPKTVATVPAITKPDPKKETVIPTTIKPLPKATKPVAKVIKSKPRIQIAGMPNPNAPSQAERRAKAQAARKKAIQRRQQQQRQIQQQQRAHRSANLKCALGRRVPTDDITISPQCILHTLDLENIPADPTVLYFVQFQFASKSYYLDYRTKYQKELKIPQSYQPHNNGYRMLIGPVRPEVLLKARDLMIQKGFKKATLKYMIPSQSRRVEAKPKAPTPPKKHVQKLKDTYDSSMKPVFVTTGVYKAFTAFMPTFDKQYNKSIVTYKNVLIGTYSFPQADSICRSGNGRVANETEYKVILSDTDFVLNYGAFSQYWISPTATATRYDKTVIYKKQKPESRFNVVCVKPH